MNEIDQFKQRIRQLEKELAEVRRCNDLNVSSLRSPLVSMESFIKTLLDDENEEWYLKEDRREFYTIIIDNIERIKKRIEEILTGTRNQTETTPYHFHWQNDVDSRALLDEVAANPDFGERSEQHQIVVDFKPESILIETDPEKFAHIFHILVRNAIKFSPDGGKIRIIGREEAPSEYYPSGSLLVEVRDQGLGWSKEQFEIRDKHLYDRISWTKPMPFMGHIVVIGFVKEHHGEFWVESEGVNKGTQCFVRIPLKQPAENSPHD